MESKTQTGYLVLADISGFTAYLAGVELDHAHEILSDLMETILHSFQAQLSISKLEGDAIFAYTPEPRVPRGETLLELIESTYMAFRDKQANMHRRTTCTCQACRAIPTLDLKFFTHYGSYILQQVGGRQEVLGADVTTAHRLMKNEVAAATGWRAYALFSEAALTHLKVRPEGGYAYLATYEHLGKVPTYSLNLQPCYEQQIAHRTVLVTPAEAHATLELTLAAPPLIVWDWLVDGAKKQVWENLDTLIIARPQGRTGAGARNHCAHGKTVEMVEDILDWKPFDYFTIARYPPQLPLKFTITYQLHPLENAAQTRLTLHARLAAPLPAAWLKPACQLFIKLRGIDQRHFKLAELIAQEVSAQR
jgi:hypothetical protein